MNILMLGHCVLVSYCGRFTTANSSPWREARSGIHPLLVRLMNAITVWGRGECERKMKKDRFNGNAIASEFLSCDSIAGNVTDAERIFARLGPRQNSRALWHSFGSIFVLYHDMVQANTVVLQLPLQAALVSSSPGVAAWIDKVKRKRGEIRYVVW